jgi:hypothetical protein
LGDAQFCAWGYRARDVRDGDPVVETPGDPGGLAGMVVDLHHWLKDFGRFMHDKTVFSFFFLFILLIYCHANAIKKYKYAANEPTNKKKIYCDDSPTIGINKLKRKKKAQW